MGGQGQCPPKNTWETSWAVSPGSHVHPSVSMNGDIQRRAPKILFFEGPQVPQSSVHHAWGEMPLFCLLTQQGSAETY